MLKSREDANLTLETLGRGSSSGVCVEDFDRNLAIVLAFVREEHGGHSTATDLSAYGVAIPNGALKGLEVQVSFPFCRT